MLLKRTTISVVLGAMLASTTVLAETITFADSVSTVADTLVIFHTKEG